MKIAVTGASGHIGACLCRFLTAEGHQLRAVIHRNRKPLDGLEVEEVRADILDKDSLEEAFKDVDRVYHLAAQISLEKKDLSSLRTLNIEGTRNVLAACKARKVPRLVHFSSIEAFSPDPSEEATTEKRALLSGKGLTYYDITKAEAELLVRKAADEGLDTIIINPTAVVGPFDYKPSFFGKVLIALYSGKLRALVRGGYNWVDVRDLVRGAYAADRGNRSGERYILSGHWLSLEGIAGILESSYGIPKPSFIAPLPLAIFGLKIGQFFSRFLPFSLAYNTGMLEAIKTHRYIDRSKAERELAYSCRPIEETVRDTIDWFIESGYIPKLDVEPQSARSRYTGPQPAESQHSRTLHDDKEN